MNKHNSSTFGLSLALVGVFAMSTGACDDDTTASASSGAGGSAGNMATVNPAAKVDIVATAEAAGFKTLVAAVKAAGLVDALKAPGPLTVFAPTDAAFAKLPAGTVESLLKPENKKMLETILTYHVVAGTVKAADVVKLSAAKTLEGREVKVTVEGGKVKLNDSNVTMTDVEASNGVIHIIDTVLLPK